MSTRARWTLGTFTLALFTIFIVWFPRAYDIKGESMMPSFHDGDKVMVVHDHYSISRFDVVIVDGKDKTLIKRVVGLPGEDVRYINGHLFINGAEVNEPFLTSIKFTLFEAYHFRLADNQYLVFGDNRLNSLDSRVFGGVKRDHILGKVIFRIW